MADEAFALSPINARAALPTDADYDAIHDAFMETSRGRWFLTEYAKRNRNADTRLVLETVERLEASVASQRQAQAEAVAAAAEAAAAQAVAAQAAASRPAVAEAQPHVDLWPELAKAFARARIEIAQRLVRDSNEDAFEAIRAGTETLKSISWALRERGFDARICDFLDIQVNKITDGCTGLMAESSVVSETETAILAAFDDLIDRVQGLTGGGDAGMESLDIVVDAVADAMCEDDIDGAMAADDDTTAGNESVATSVGTFADQSRGVFTDPILTDDSSSPPVRIAAAAAAEPSTIETPSVGSYPDAAFHEIYGDDSDIEIVDVAPIEEPPAAPTEPEINRQRLYEAKLAPYRAPTPADTRATIASVVEDIEIVDVSPAAHAQPAESAAIDPRDQPVAEVAATLSSVVIETPSTTKPSLGHALLASGLIQSTDHRPDPLAPFRRMSQAERVAFFT